MMLLEFYLVTALKVEILTDTVGRNKRSTEV